MKTAEEVSIEEAYGGENYYIIGEYIDERGWINENYLHDPVCVAGYDKEYREVPVDSYLSDLNYRPIQLRYLDKLP